MRTGHRRGADPREVVEAPVIAALDGIILRAAIGFSSVAALAWSRWCRAWLARAENESGDRLREYWSRVGH